MEIVSKEIKKNPLMHRDELSLKIKFEKMPSRAEIREVLARNYNVAKELIAIRNIFTEFGSKEANVVAFIYENKEWLDKFEILKKKDKEQIEKQQEAKKEEQEKLEEKKEEKQEEKEEKGGSESKEGNEEGGKQDSKGEEENKENKEG